MLVDVVPDPDPGRVRSWLEDRGLGGHYTELVDDVLSSAPELLCYCLGVCRWPSWLWGRRSPLSDADLDRLRAANRGVAITRVTGAGHLVARDAPAEAARTVASHASVWLGAYEIVTRAFRAPA